MKKQTEKTYKLFLCMAFDIHRCGQKTILWTEENHVGKFLNYCQSGGKDCKWAVPVFAQQEKGEK